jgi:hypothetical protein
MRKRLAKLGYSSEFESLSCWKAEAFMYISQELDRLEAAEMKKRSKRRGRR